ncbi:hypothetical protein BDM02DRAFT_3104566 [Thelephora ganbajun]|uniref:Uncharacterized protein n=1 Tax=Thelephora ganbajun TaxID=370292 RepID=A0ACB6Z0U6_THEGA|nr:hypothetical protein BDM02DRAFT_3104566 [Thelephora ganbajun]
MYLAGVIPGPGKPSLDQINHVLSLLVLELLDFWKGVFYTMTFSSASGLLIKGALISLVCDMLAACQLCGLGSATSTWFCTFCLLTIHKIENLDKSSWPPRVHRSAMTPRNLGEQTRQARCWRDCENEADQEAIFKAFGVCWSVLLDLPYWNPILFAVVDSMHAVYLGLLQSHCQKVWQINASIEGGDGTVIKLNKPIPRPDDHVLSKWLGVICTTDPDLLHDELSQDCSKETLWHICVDNNIQSAGTWKQLIKHIVKSVSTASEYFWLPTFDSLLKRSCVDPDSIKLPTASRPYEDDDESIESDNLEDERHFQQKVEKADKAFEEYKTSDWGLGHVRKPVLWAMLPPEPVSESRDVLGRNILEAVWEDMTRTELPSWMSPAPWNWGTATRGKLTADQWKVIATVHLPITLMRLWGAPQEGRYFLMLCNFMDLSAAVQLTNQRVITEKHIKDYEHLILRYLSGMMIMFKDIPLQPIHHVSMHAGEFLRLFGPTHSVRTPGFKRFNEKLGLQNTNKKLGELEATFTTTACRTANLEWMLQGQAQDSVRPLVEAFLRVSNEDHQGTRLADEAHFPPNKPPKMVTLNHRTHRLLLQVVNDTSTTGSHSFHTSDALELEKVSISSIIYATEKSLPQDSNVIFQQPGGSSHRVGQIKSIFQVRYQPGATFLTVSQHHLIANSNVQNVYRRFGFARGFLCDAEEDDRLLVIRSEDVVCHFTKTTLEPKEEKLMHALPLNTVHNIINVGS